MDLRLPEDVSVLRAAFDRASAVHVGIDIQRIYCEPNAAMVNDPRYKQIGKAVARIGDFTRDTRGFMPPVWVNHTSLAVSAADIGDYGPVLGLKSVLRGTLRHIFSTHAQRARDQIYGFHAAPEDVTVGKPRWDGFENSNLDSVLKARGVDTLVLTGFFAEQCVRYTARSAIRHGYQVFVAADMTLTTFSKPRDCWHHFRMMGARVVLGQDIPAFAVAR